MNFSIIIHKVIEGERLSLNEAFVLYNDAPTSALIYLANLVRYKLHPHNKVSWMIDRNVNITNACITRCKFCNFHCAPNSDEVFITTMEQYAVKIKELFDLGGNQLLLQGGMHPKLGLAYYKNLFFDLKKNFPGLRLHALGPPEIVHIAKMENLTYKQVLIELVQSGLDSLPGAGAEILSNRARAIVSPAKCSVEEWLDVMRDAHQLRLLTSATMMFGHVETLEERMQHLDYIRSVQDEKPNEAPGFKAFIAWPFMDEGTRLKNHLNVSSQWNKESYVRLIAISRIFLDNIENIQASWLTVGLDTAQLCLHSGANDLGSIMIEENVVSKAGVSFTANKELIENSIREAGFKPVLRDQAYHFAE